MARKGYARPELLVSSAWLAAHVDDANLRLVDAGVRVGDEERAERIRGAVSLPHPYIKGEKDVRHVAMADEAKAIIEGLGIGDNTQVIVYDSARSLNSARFWWVLSYYGHQRVKILNGGLEKWTAEGRPTTTEARRANPASFTPRENPFLLSTVDTMRAAIDDSSAAIWDTRSLAEFTGENDRGNARAGHVPGARHLEWSDLVRADATFKPASEIRAALVAIGITPDKEIHTY